MRIQGEWLHITILTFFQKQKPVLPIETQPISSVVGRPYTSVWGLRRLALETFPTQQHLSFYTRRVPEVLCGVTPVTCIQTRTTTWKHTLHIQVCIDAYMYTITLKRTSTQSQSQDMPLTSKLINSAIRSLQPGDTTQAKSVWMTWLWSLQVVAQAEKLQATVHSDKLINCPSRDSKKIGLTCQVCC